MLYFLLNLLNNNVPQFTVFITHLRIIQRHIVLNNLSLYTHGDAFKGYSSCLLYCSFSDRSSTMPLKLFIALMLTMTCAISLQCVDARSLRKSSASNDVTDDDVTSHDTIVKRSPREVRGRRRTYSAPVMGSVPVMVGRGGARSSRLQVADARRLLSDDERLQIASLLADVSLLERLRQRRPIGHHFREVWAAPYGQLDDEDLMRSLEETDDLVYGTEDGKLAEGGPGLPMKRTTGHLRSPRELHPVYLGLGQNAASAALNTYASLLADEKRRENLEQQQQNSANPVRFIGRR